MKNQAQVLGMLFALGLTFLSRTLSWHYKGGLFRRDGSANVDGYLEAAQMVSDGRFSQLMAYRPTQLLYPLLLSPLTKFHLSEDIYIFWLHMALSLLTTFVLYLVAKEVVGKKFALLSVISFAIFPFPLAWFRWVFTETLYYPLLFIHILSLFYALEHRRGLFWMILSSIALFFTKLDGLPFLALSWVLIWMKYVSARLGKQKAFGLLCAITLGVGTVVGVSVSNSPKAMKKLREHFHVSHGLWLSTHTTSNANAVEHNAAIDLIERSLPISTCRTKPLNLALEELCRRDFITRSAWKTLTADPLRWLGNSFIRLSSHLFPAIYHTAWSVPFRLYHLSLAIFVIFGALFGLLFVSHEYSSKTKILFWLGFATLIVPMFYEADAELRFRIPSQILWLSLAPMGWFRLAQWLREKTKSNFIPQQANELS